MYSQQNMFYGSLRLNCLVVWALFTRNLRNKFFDNGILSLFMPLLIQLGIQLGIFYILDRHTIMGMHKVLFIIAGFIPYLIFDISIRENAMAFQQARDSLAIKQIKISDVVLSNCFTSLITSIIVYVIALFVAYFIVGIHFEVYYWSGIVNSLLISFFITVGLSLIFAVIGAYIKFAFIWAMVFTRFFYFTSGIYFPIDVIPYNIRKYLLLNPMLHLVELDRYAFLSTKVRDGANFIYPAFCALVCMFFGLVVYVAFKNIFLKKAFA